MLEQIDESCDLVFGSPPRIVSFVDSFCLSNFP